MSTTISSGTNCLWLVALSLLWAAGLFAAEGPAKPRPAKRPAVKPAVEIDAQEEQRVLTFLREHHRELADLLGHLRMANPKDYQRAIRDLARGHDRLAQLQKGDPQRYELELKSWVLTSRIELVVAKLAINDTPELRAELDRRLNERLDVRLQLLEWDRSKAAERLQKADEQLAELRKNRSEVIERQRAMLTKGLQKMTPGSKSCTSPEGRKPKTQTPKS
jgi:hypothetical protein